MGAFTSCCKPSATDIATPDAEAKRHQLLEAAERRRRQEETRGIKNLEKVKKMEEKTEYNIKKEKELEHQGEPKLKVEENEEDQEILEQSFGDISGIGCYRSVELRRLQFSFNRWDSPRPSRWIRLNATKL